MPEPRATKRLQERREDSVLAHGESWCNYNHFNLFTAYPPEAKTTMSKTKRKNSGTPGTSFTSFLLEELIYTSV